jgi:hypothetical protein
VTRRRGRRRKQLLNDLKETEEAGTLEREALDPNLWRIRCARGCGPAVKTDHGIMSHVQQTEDGTPSASRITFHVLPTRSLSHQDNGNILPLKGALGRVAQSE